MTAGSGKIERKEVAGVVEDSLPNTRPFTTIDDIIAVEATTKERKLATRLGCAMAAILIASTEIP
jgi:hypothetical protein